MRTLTLFEHISLDGIIQTSGTENGFPYGDWTVPYSSPQGRDAIVAAHGTPFDLLLGRRTYDLWSGHWPTAPSGPLADAFNAATKHVVTHRPESLQWDPSMALGPDFVEGTRRLKNQPGPRLITWGSATLTSALLEHGLVDELILISYPVLLGEGKRLFAPGTPAQAFRLVGTMTFPSGAVLSTYQGASPLRSA